MRNREFQPDLLLQAAKSGEGLTKEEVRQVASSLADPTSSYDKYTLIHILGRAGSREYQHVIEGFLNESVDPQLARLALTVLCDWWGLTPAYLPQVLGFARGRYWDLDQQVRQTALSIIGEYARDQTDPYLLFLLLDIAQDATEWDLIREDAVRALARSIGLGYTELPPASKREAVDSDWSRDVMSRVKRILFP